MPPMMPPMPPGGAPPAQQQPNNPVAAALMPRLRSLTPEKRQVLMGLDPAEVAVIAELLPEIAPLIVGAHRSGQQRPAPQAMPAGDDEMAEGEMPEEEAPDEPEEEEQEEAPPPPQGATPLRPGGNMRPRSRLGSV